MNKRKNEQMNTTNTFAIIFIKLDWNNFCRGQSNNCDKY